jgi:predicted nucleotidyltransferase
VEATRARIGDLLRLLARHGVEHIVVGGVAAVLQGAPILTRDLDIVHSRSPDNIRRLLAALAEVHAFYRTRTDRRFEPGEAELASAGHQLLATDLGDLDLLGTVGEGQAFDDLLGRTVRFELSGASVTVLDLAAVIELKEAVGRDKDRAVLAVLRHVLAGRGGPSRA